MNNIQVLERPALSLKGERRFVVVNIETGEILDDAQGYGYKSIRNAWAAYGYKTRDKSKDEVKKAKQEEIRNWLREQKDFYDCLKANALELTQGYEKYGKKALEYSIADTLKEFGLKPECTVHQLVEVWKNEKLI